MHRRIALCLITILLAVPVLSAEPPASLGASPSFNGVELGVWEVIPLFEGANQGLALNSDIVLDVRPSPPPNAFGSPSWGPYLANAMPSLITGGGDVGDRATDPTAYHILNDGRFGTGDIMVTSFKSWRGLAAPPAPFNLEYGNRLHCGLAAESIGGEGAVTFTLRDVIYMMWSSDHILDFAGTLEGTTCDGVNRWCLNYGPDLEKDVPDETAPDDIWFTSGESDTTEMHALYYRGPGNAYWPGAGDPNAGQAELDEASEYLLSEVIHFNCGFFVRGNQNTVELVVDTPFFADGFESGDTTTWSSVSP